MSLSAFAYLQRGQIIQGKLSSTVTITVHTQSTWGMTLVSTDDFDSYETWLTSNGVLNQGKTRGVDPSFYNAGTAR